MHEAIILLDCPAIPESRRFPFDAAYTYIHKREFDKCSANFPVCEYVPQTESLCYNSRLSNTKI